MYISILFCLFWPLIFAHNFLCCIHTHPFTLILDFFFLSKNKRKEKKNAKKTSKKKVWCRRKKKTVESSEFTDILPFCAVFDVSKVLFHLFLLLFSSTVFFLPSLFFFFLLFFLTILLFSSNLFWFVLYYSTFLFFVFGFFLVTTNE